MSVNDYYTMLVYENGYALTDSLEISSDDSAYFSKRGAKTLTQCPSREAIIHGNFREEVGLKPHSWSV